MTNVTEAGDLMQWNNELVISMIPLHVLLCMYILLGVVGNSVVVYIYGFRLKIGMDDRYFILVLGILDTIVCLANTAFSLWRISLPVNSTGNIICKVSWFFTRTVSTTSGLLILVIALQRYLKVCRPFGKQMTTLWKRLLLCLAIMMSCLMHIPLFVFYGELSVPNIKRNVTGKRCGRVNSNNEVMTAEMGYFYFMFVCAGIVLAAIILLYTLIGRRIYEQVRRKRNRRKSSMPSSESSLSYTQDDNGTADVLTETPTISSSIRSQKSVRSRNLINKSKRKRKNPLENHRYSLMFMLISAVCVFTYVPSLTANIITNIDSVEFWTEFTNGWRCWYIFLFQLYLLNHVANPFIYGLFDGTFRGEVKRLFCTCCRK